MNSNRSSQISESGLPQADPFSSPPMSILGTPSSAISEVRFSIPNSPAASASDRDSVSEGPSSSSRDSIHRNQPHSSYTAQSSPELRRSALYRRSNSSRSIPAVRKPWPSTMLVGEIEKPWIQHVDPVQRWVKALFWGLLSTGLVGAALICYQGYASIPNIGKTCLVMNDDFSAGLRSEYWNREVRLDGYGNKQFEWTTASSNNSYVQDNTLYIVPTLTSDVIGTSALTNGYTLNLTADGTCTSKNLTECVAISNSSTSSIINPVQAARLTTKGKASLRYGKVEVTARMPTGDWLWPAIWLLPEENKYGDWPLSGEIDMAESRGNGFEYNERGADYLSSALHWGPLQSMDSYWRTWGVVKDKIKGFNSGFHTYTLEWDEKHLVTYVDSKMNKIYEINFNKPMWEIGSFPQYYQNGTTQQKLLNPWVKSENKAAPFDQSFYLILNVAVGGQNGYFPDNLGNKPWNDGADSAMSDFWAAKDRWLPTWPTDPTKRGMAVKSVKMWQKC